jgi:group I intron endonuclease
VDDFYVYIWTNRISGKQYVGKGIGRRAADHMRSAFHKRKGCTAFYRAIALYGPEHFEMRFLATGLSEDLAFALECAAIDAYGSQREGYNCTSGGEGVRMPRTAEHNRRISEAHKGLRHTENSKKRISDGKTNPSKETRDKMRLAKLGKKMPAETKAKKSAALKGRPWSEARRAAQQAPKKGT